jgi:hypothetical protein
MAEEKERKTQERREAGTGRERQEGQPTGNPGEAHEGVPGYGQPPEEVRREKLPEQKW